MEVYVVIIRGALTRTEYVDSIYSNENSALMHSDELQEELGDEYIVDVEVFPIKEDLYELG
jgi:hypothetical protein